MTVGMRALATAAALTSAQVPASGQVDLRVIGPESRTLPPLTELSFAYRIGDEDGAGMLEQASVLAMAPDPDGSVLVYTSYYGDGPIQRFRDGEVEAGFGRRGDGPGEYQLLGTIRVEPRTRTTWVTDRTRVVSFTPDGKPGPVFQKHPVGGWSDEFVILSDGSFLFSGPGSTQSNLGFLLHRYHPATGSWRSHHPLFRDRTFDPFGEPHEWRRQLAKGPPGVVVAVGDDYRIEVFDESRGGDLRLREAVRRRPPGWPADPISDNHRRSVDTPAGAPPFRVVDAVTDSAGRLWVISWMPEEDWEDDLRDDPRRPGSKAFLTPDKGVDSLIEILDPESWSVEASYRVEPALRYFLDAGLVAYHERDLPFPTIAVSRVPHPTRR